MNRKTDHEAAPAVESDVPPEVLGEARNLVALFLKALKAYRLYLPNNRTLQTFLDAFYDALVAFIARHGDVSFRLSQFRITWEGETVYENTTKEESLSFRLFIHGVREFTFHEGIPAAEASAFLQVINRAFDSKTSVDDLLTLLWERDLRFINFIILDDFFDEAEQSEFEEFVADGRRADQTAGSMKATMQPLLDRLLSRSEGPDPNPAAEIYALTAEEQERLTGWVQAERDRDLIRELCSVLLELIEPAALDESAAEVVNILDRVVDALLSEGKFREFVSVIRQLKDFGKANGAESPVARLVSEALGRIGGDRMIRLTEPLLVSADIQERELLIDFLSDLDQTAVAPLLELLERPPTKDVATRILKRMADRHFALLVTRVTDPRRTVAVSIIRLLAEIGDPRALLGLRDCIAQGDATLRQEAIRAVGAIGTEAAFPLLRDVLADPEQEIRVLAVRALALLPPEVVRRPLFEMARSRDFPNRTYFEKKEILTTLGKVADPEIEEWLGSVLRHRPWFRRDQYDELRTCAITALAAIGSPRAVEWIRASAQDRSPAVRRAASQALRAAAT